MKGFYDSNYVYYLYDYPFFVCVIAQCFDSLNEIHL